MGSLRKTGPTGSLGPRAVDVRSEGLAGHGDIPVSRSITARKFGRQAAARWVPNGVETPILERFRTTEAEGRDSNPRWTRKRP